MSVPTLTARRTRVSFVHVLSDMAPVLLAVALFCGVGVLHVTTRVLTVRLGYALSELDQKVAQERRRNAQLRLELATLRSPARLEGWARELGLAAPAPAALLNLRAAAPASGKARP